MKTEADFSHQQSAHCESGVVASLLAHHGIQMSEPMALGLSSAITFAYIPIVKLNGLPLITYRMPPKYILKGIQKRIGVKFNFKKFSKPAAGMDALDQALADGKLVGLQGSVYWLPYFPEDMRFHFNAHNMLAYGKKDGSYLISDPIFEEPVTVKPEDLQRSRFAKGALAAKGLMYSVSEVPESIDLEQAVKKSVKKSIKIMLKAPLPIVGIRGISYLAKKIRFLDKKVTGLKKQKLWLGHVIRMQEEIGTGGAGFRFIYASFLQEAGEKINKPELIEAANMMTAIGDKWRQFALSVARACKGKDAIDLNALADELEGCAEAEAKVWRFLEDLYH